MPTLTLKPTKHSRTAHAEYKGKTIRRVKSGYKIVGQTKVYKTLTELTDKL